MQVAAPSAPVISPRRAVAFVAALLFTASLLVVDAVRAPRAEAYPLGDGYWTVASDGGIFAFGDAQFFGSTGAIRLNQPIVGMAATPFLEGYWFVARDGGIFAFGSAGFHGSTGDIRLNQPVVGMAAHPSGEGYWFVAADGGIFSFGAAKFHGSTGATRLNQPIVGMASTPSGDGYWLVARDGGIFSFGDAAFHGSTGAIRLNRPVVGMTPAPSGNGYWFVAADGGIFSFGDAPFHGSTGDIRLNQPVVGMDVTQSGNGYRFVAADGGIFSFGDAAFHGSTGGIRLNQPMVGMATRPPLAVKVDAFEDAAGETSEWREAADGDWQLALQDTDSDDVPAGALVLGVAGFTIDQLGTIGFTLDSGACNSSPRLNLYLDTNADGTPDETRTYACQDGGGGATKSFNPQNGAGSTPAVAAGAVVTGMDIISTSPTLTLVDDIVVAGITVTDFNTAPAT